MRVLMALLLLVVGVVLIGMAIFQPSVDAIGLMAGLAMIIAALAELCWLDDVLGDPPERHRW